MASHQHQTVPPSDREAAEMELSLHTVEVNDVTVQPVQKQTKKKPIYHKNLCIPFRKM